MREVTLRVGSWRVCGELNTIDRGDESRRLGPKVMATLTCLARRPGRVIAKQELVDQVWGGAFTTDEAVAAVIYELRKALDDDARAPTYVETIRGSGYRLVAPVAPWPDAQEAELQPGQDRARQAVPALRRRASWLAGAAGLLTLAILATWAAWGWRTAAPASPQEAAPAKVGATAGIVPPSTEPCTLAIRSLAVLPVSTLVGGDLGQDELALGLTEALRAELAIRRPVEIAPLPEPAAGDRWDQRRVARDLEVGAVLEGSIYRADARVLVSVQLVDLDTGAMLWGRTYERAVEDPLAVQFELARDIAGQVDTYLRRR